MDIVYHNENYQESKLTAVSINNRSFNYGDGFFETIRIFNGTAIFWQYHYSRIEKAAKTLGFENLPSSTNLLKIITELSKKNNAPNARIRLNFYRKGQGLYTPDTNEIGLTGKCIALKSKQFTLNNKGLEVGIFTTYKLSAGSVSSIKTNNALPYILAAKHVKANNLDTALLINNNNQIVDSIYSNIWIVKNDILHTPPLNSGGVTGTMQSFLTKMLNTWGYKHITKPLHKNDLQYADELFLTNAIKGIQWVKNFNQKQFNKKISEQLLNELNNYLSSIT